MIFVAAGTQDGRELASYIAESGYETVASVVSRYGKSLLEIYPRLRINDQPLDREGLKAFLVSHGVTHFVDASHPYAEQVSCSAMSVCRELAIPYIRYERRKSPIDYDNIHSVICYEDAAKVAASLGNNIFLTTGSRRLHIFKESSALVGKNLIIRVLPDAKVLAACEELGFSPKQIIAMQGPFSERLNEELYKKYQAEVIVTKNSGDIGGTDTKIAAAMRLSLPIVLIDRPEMHYDIVAESFEEVIAFIGKE